jgi:tetratricopeptide (TPR) repeat protein
VLLDNAKDEAQVRHLLPGKGCSVIITSQRILGALEGTTVHNLKVLNEAEAWNLLAKLVGIERLQAESKAAAKILQLCHGLPLAIRIVGGTLKSKLHWKLIDYSQKLTDERRRLEQLQLSDLSVRASFELSYQQLSPADRLLFNRLGILVGRDFGQELARVFQESDNPVPDGIERLIDAQLLEANTDSRYRFHDLLRLYAREKLEKSTSINQQEVIKQQIVDWCDRKSKIMDTWLRPAERLHVVQRWIDNREVTADFNVQGLAVSAMAWFEQEREQLLSAIDWANHADRWDIVVSLVANLLVFFQARSYLYEWEKTGLMAVTAAKKLDDRYGEGRSIHNLGMVYRAQNRWEEAINCYEQSLAIFCELGNKQGESHSLDNLGIVYNSQSRSNEAIDCHNRSLAICRELGDRCGESRSLNNLGAVYRFQSRWAEAIDYFHQSLIICLELRDRPGESQCFNNLGNVYYSQNQWDVAIQHYEHSLIICRELNNRHAESQSLTNLGNVYQSKSRWNDAIDCYQKSLVVFRELGDCFREAASLNNLGIVYFSQSHFDKAIDCYQKSLTRLNHWVIWEMCINLRVDGIWRFNIIRIF